jgi:hypothetical protein
MLSAGRNANGAKPLFSLGIGFVVHDQDGLRKRALDLRERNPVLLAFRAVARVPIEALKLHTPPTDLTLCSAFAYTNATQSRKCGGKGRLYRATPARHSRRLHTGVHLMAAVL